MFLGYVLLLCFLSCLALPVLWILSFIIYIGSGSPIIFRQNRIGKNGKIFEIYKFRTMIPDSESRKKALLKHNEANGPVFKIHNDPRFTSIGKFLAHTGLDELPQLWNVIKGDMALIGPRPLPLDEVAKLKPWQRKRHNIKPGIISPWILQGYHSMKFNDWMKSDIAYIQQKSFWYDCTLAILTLRFLFTLVIREMKSAIYR